MKALYEKNYKPFQGLLKISVHGVIYHVLG